GSHVHTGPEHAAGELCGRGCRRTRRPWQLAVKEPSDTGSRRVGNQGRIAYLASAVTAIRRDLDQPGADRGLGRVELDNVIEQISILVGGYRSRDESIRIDRRAERIILPTTHLPTD